MAVGVIFAGLLSHKSGITYASAIALSLGIAIQNVPEGAIISLPLKSEGKSKLKSFIFGMLSGIVEPIGAVLSLIASNTIESLLPYFLSFAAGAMIFVTVNELIPQSKSNDNTCIISFTLGFLIMMILDIML